VRELVVLDDKGLVKENNYLVAYIPANNKALVWRVISRYNNGFEVINYGSLPILAGTTLSSYDGGTVTVSTDGYLPARSYTSNGISFPYTGVFDETDMWYLPKEQNDRLFHVIQYVTPRWLRMDVQIPAGVSQAKFQKDKVQLGIEKDFGFTRGRLEVIHLHQIHYGYRYGNDTNLEVKTGVKFVYGEYIVETPKDPELIFNILNKRVPAHWVTIPISYMDATIYTALRDAYGYDGFLIYPANQRQLAINEYTTVLAGVKR